MTTLSTTIIDAIKKRDFVYQRVTNSLANKLSFVFDAIMEHLNVTLSDLSWENIYVAKDETLIIVAKLTQHHTFRPRHVQSITVGIPLDIIELQSKEKILEFFSMAADDSGDSDDEDVDLYEEQVDNSRYNNKRVLH